ncbi:hypothetical protein bpr_I1128 [Butyrivibrio proteoclasticus B316]|uniref:Uncharacterized protein n=1 Tax=Butyrivibrio proteoclasticus (strain ATCC 51982 / DSM 14932 / B316) TaxID=515622 RepID=E0S243_BUTPB|nr:hypothetical protein bpr_I1128 [Butyrivibrio proteoclasticus B316]
MKKAGMEELFGFLFDNVDKMIEAKEVKILL